MQWMKSCLSNPNLKVVISLFSLETSEAPFKYCLSEPLSLLFVQKLGILHLQSIRLSLSPFWLQLSWTLQLFPIYVLFFFENSFQGSALSTSEPLSVVLDIFVLQGLSLFVSIFDLSPGYILYSSLFISYCSFSFLKCYHEFHFISAPSAKMLNK